MAPKIFEGFEIVKIFALSPPVTIRYRIIFLNIITMLIELNEE